MMGTTVERPHQQSLCGGTTKDGWLYIREDGAAVLSIPLFSRIQSIQFHSISLVPVSQIADSVVAITCQNRGNFMSFAFHHQPASSLDYRSSTLLSESKLFSVSGMSQDPTS